MLVITKIIQGYQIIEADVKHVLTIEWTDKKEPTREQWENNRKQCMCFQKYLLQS